MIEEIKFENQKKGLCIVCGQPIPIDQRQTCSEKCHEDFVQFLENKYGKYKTLVDITTGKIYIVPIRDIIEKRITLDDMRKYPEEE